MPESDYAREQRLFLSELESVATSRREKREAAELRATHAAAVARGARASAADALANSLDGLFKAADTSLELVDDTDNPQPSTDGLLTNEDLGA